jgi:glycosyltransferase involved in cell wall biosynthesis
MRIGVLPGNRNAGGVFQVGLSMIQALTPGSPDELVLVHNDNRELPLEALRDAGWETAAIPSETGSRLAPVRRVARRAGLTGLHQRTLVSYPNPDDVRHDPVLEGWLAGLRIELMLYPVPTMSAFEVSVPYVAAVHDLQHRLHPEFPEVSANGEAEAREYLFRNLVRSALVVIVDSETGREDVLECYGAYIEPARVEVLPFVPPPYLFAPAPGPIDVHALHGLPDRYLIYPAQFWPHKNHLRLVEAIALLRARGVEVTLALCGTHEGRLRSRTYADVRGLARNRRIDRHVRLLGYVPDHHMRALYSQAVALVMPTFFGPTNIPVLEAWAAGCPVVTSDIRGIREQVGDAALLVDPSSTEAIADGILRIWEDDALRDALVEAGRSRLRELQPQQYRDRLLQILDHARERVRAGERDSRAWRRPSAIRSN